MYIERVNGLSRGHNFIETLRGAGEPSLSLIACRERVNEQAPCLVGVHNENSKYAKSGGKVKTTGFQVSRLGRPVPRPSWPAGKWASLVTASVHAPVAAFRTAPGNLSAVVNPKFGDALPSVVSASV